MTLERIADMLETLLRAGYDKSEVREFARRVFEDSEDVLKLYATRNDLKTRIYQCLTELEISSDMHGYDYLVECLVCSYDHPEVFEKGLLFTLYHMVGEKFGIKPANVRDTLKKLLDSSSRINDPLLRRKYFRDYLSCGTLVPHVFIHEMVNYLKGQE